MGSRTVSQPTVTLLAALIGVSGALAGLVVERFLRSFGRMWCEPSGWEMKFLSNFNEYGESNEVVPEEADGVTYSVRLDLFNGKEIPVGLRDITIVFVCEGGEVSNKPWDSTTGKFSSGRTDYEKLVVVNLSPRQWVHLPLRGGFGEQDEIRLLAGWSRVDFVGQRQRRGIIESKTYRETIATKEVPRFRSPQSSSWWRRYFGF